MRPMAGADLERPAGQACRERPRSRLPALPRLRWPGDRRRVLGGLARHPAVLSVLVTAAGTIVWLTVFPRIGTDLSAQIARAGWASRYPGSAYLFSWYGGMYPASYSLLAPYLLGVTGTRQAAAAAAVLSAGLLSLLLVRHRCPGRGRPRCGRPWPC